MAGNTSRAAASPHGADPQAVQRGANLTAEQTKQLRARQKSRNRAVLVVLLCLIALFFALTISRMSQVNDPQALSRPGALGPAGGHAVPLTSPAASPAGSPAASGGGAPSATAPSR